LHCEINPEVGSETEPLTSAYDKKNYAVVGGGIAGMEAAITLKQRGHKVTLFEKNELGGQFILAIRPPGKSSLRKQIDFFKNELNEIQVTKKDIKPADVIGKFDGVILATGSKPFIPNIEGLTKYKCSEILSETNTPENKKILIIGGGSLGIEIASALIGFNNKIIIVEMTDNIAPDMEKIARKLTLQSLRENGVMVYKNSKVERVAHSSYFLKSKNVFNGLRIDNIDICVVAAGMQPENELMHKLENQIPVYPVGDADKTGDVVSAIQSAYLTCKEL